MQQPEAGSEGYAVNGGGLMGWLGLIVFGGFCVLWFATDKFGVGLMFLPFVALCVFGILWAAASRSIAKITHRNVFGVFRNPLA